MAEWDCFKISDGFKVINKTVYIAVGLRSDGLEEVLGLWIGKNESAYFWMGFSIDIKERGTEDSLEFRVDITKIIYRIKLIENLDGKIRKYTRNKLSFPTDEALMKTLYSSVREPIKK